MSDGEQLPRGKRLLFTFLLLGVLPVLGVVLLEGAASFGILVMDIAAPPEAPTEQRYTEYDPDLGWISKPDLHLPNMYGPGISFRTNRQRFRHRGPVPAQVSPGRLRVVCSGDSFVLGFGVDDDQTWCRLLAAQDDRLESVNMGQAGYGMDQAFLWYRRDGLRFDHDVHLFAFIWDDLTRMTNRAFVGFGKPVLVLRDGRLMVENVPVPRRPYRLPELTRVLRRSREALSDLRTFEVARRIRAALVDREAMRTAADTATYRLAESVFLELAKLHRARGSQLVLLHLPAPDDAQYEPARSWGPRIRRLAEREQLVYIDLAEDLGRLPPDSLDRLFRPDMHYTALGNQWLAQRVYAHLLRVPAIARRLGGRRSGGEATALSDR